MRILVEGEDLEEIIKKMTEKAKSATGKVVVLCSEETKNNFEDFDILCLGSRNKPGTFAQSLFDAFRKCDDEGYETAVLEGIEKEGIGLAVMNRATRASHK